MSDYDHREFNSMLKEWIADFNTNRFHSLIMATKLWLKEAVKLVDDPKLPATGEFIRDTKLLVAWCDHHGAPDPSILSEMLFMFTSAHVDRDSTDISQYLASKMNFAALLIERILHRAILLGASPTAVTGIELSDIQKDIVSTVQKTKGLKTAQDIADAAEFYKDADPRFRDAISTLKRMSIIDKVGGVYVVTKKS